MIRRNVGQILQQINNQEFSCNLRSLEKLNKKLINKQHALSFNLTCIKEKLLPHYTNIRLHDPAARHETFTKEYRVNLMERQAEQCLAESEYLQQRTQELRTSIVTEASGHELKNVALNLLDDILNQYHRTTLHRINMKLSRLYKGSICIKEQRDCYLNLSSHKLTENQKTLLNLGTNCHIKSKWDILQKSTWILCGN
jgi:hypothetical protein